MSQALTVPTHFGDIAELSQGFLDRVEQDTLILYGPIPHEEGSTIEFAILLGDGSVAIEGTGVVRASVDGGEDRIPETRYDIVLGGLGLQGRNEVVFESLVLAREAVSERPEAPEGSAVDQDETAEASEEPALAEPEFSESMSPTVVASMESVEPVDVMESPAADADEEASPEPEAFGTEEEPLEAAFADDGEQEVPTEPPAEYSPDASLEAEQPEPEEQPLAVEAEASTPPAEDFGAWDDEPSVHDRIEASAETDEPASESEPSSEPEPAFEPEPLDRVAELAQLDDGDPDALEAEGELGPEPSIPPIDASIPPGRPQAAKPPSEPPPPPSFSLEVPPEGLTRPSRTDVSDTEPPSVEMQELEPASGLFQYEAGLPIPSRPPLPNLDPARRVDAAEVPSELDSEPPLELVQSDRPSSEPPFVEEGYEEVRLSEPPFAEEG